MPEKDSNAARSTDPGRPPRPIVALVAVLLVALVGHFSIVWLYLTPNNPLKIELWKPVHTYMDPLFTQNWQLFAPTPIAHDELMMVKLRWKEKESGKGWESSWIDITTPVNNRIHQYRVGPYSKIARPYSTMKDMVNYTDPIAQAVREEASQVVLRKLRQGEIERRRTGKPAGLAPDSALLAMLDSVSRPTDSERNQRREGREMMYRVASAYAKEMMNGKGELRAVNVRFETRQFPRFSERKNPDAKTTSKFTPPYGWEKPRADVALP